MISAQKEVTDRNLHQGQHMPSQFKPIPRNEHLPTRIAEDLGSRIADGRLRAGERIPTEHELGQAFGVSRSVVREAIAQLKNEGLVETRQGVGAFVTDQHKRMSLRIELADLNTPQGFRSFFQVRLPLEVEAAGLAALHRTDEDLAALNEALAGIRAATKWDEGGTKADIAFHHALSVATHNPYFPIFLGFIAQKISASINTAFTWALSREIEQQTVLEHEMIFDAIKRKNADDARLAMRHHLLGAADRLSVVWTETKAPQGTSLSARKRKARSSEG